MAGNESMLALAPILHLPPVNKEQMAPLALMRYLNLLTEIYDEVPTDELCEDDLVEKEKTKREENTDKIREWIQNCSKDSSQSTLMVYPYAMVISDYLRDLKGILKTAYGRKLENQRRQAMKEKRLKALHEVNPPVDDAERYLTDDEQEPFAYSVPDAIDAYLDGGKGCPLNDWRFDIRAHDYTRWTLTIKKRKEKEILAKNAEKDLARFIEEIKEAIDKLKKGLAKEKKPSFAYPQSLIKYLPGRWCDLDMPGTSEVEEWAEPYVWKRVPPIIKNLVSWNLTWQVLWLPRIKYELLGVPSLVWCYKAQVLIKVNLAITERIFNKQFHGHECTITVKTQDLGCFYLDPVEWGDDQEGFSTPVALLSMLSEGKLEDDGIEIIETADTRVGYIVRGYQGEYVEIDQKFRQFIIDITKDSTLAKGLLASGVIDELMADMIRHTTMLPSQTTVIELAKWSNEQRLQPTEIEE